MSRSIRNIPWLRLSALALLTALLSACIGVDGTGSASSSVSTTSSTTATAVDVAFSGSVGDGPVTGATVEIWNAQGQLIKTETSDNTASFSTSFKVKGNNYPLLLKVRGGTDLVTGGAPDFQLMSVMYNPGAKQVNINPFSTLIVQTASQMPGGLTSANITTVPL